MTANEFWSQDIAKQDQKFYTTNGRFSGKNQSIEKPGGNSF